MNLYQKISILGPGAQYDTCGPRDFGLTTNIPGVYNAKVNGHTCRLFKVLQSNCCQNNCRYCAFRRDRDISRTTASPEEMAGAFVSAWSRRLVDGLFLSSGIVGGVEQTMSRLLDTAHILRDRYKYRGYVHLKVMPGSSRSCIEESLKLANRISVNIESPTSEDLSFLSPEKDLKTGFFDTIFTIKKELSKLKSANKRAPSLTTQFVVGAGRERDEDIVRTTNLLYGNFGFKRVFYSAFRPVEKTPLERLPATPLLRQNRLYQADFLMRFYRFTPNDFSFDMLGHLPLLTDPKAAWVEQHPGMFPINVNIASYWDLLKIPRIGPTSAKKILERRRRGRIQSIIQLAQMKMPIEKIEPYVRF